MMYNEETKSKILNMLRKGQTIVFACEYAGVCRATYYKWLKDHADFKEATDNVIENFRIETVGKTITALHKSAWGYDYDEIKVAEAMNKQGEVVELLTTTKKNVPPNFNAQAFILTNRDPKNWRLPQAIPPSENEGSENSQKIEIVKNYNKEEKDDSGQCSKAL